MFWLIAILVASAQTPVRCCDHPGAVEVVDGYLKLHNALAVDGSPFGACYFLNGVLRKVRRERGLSNDDKAVIDELIAVMGRVKDSTKEKVRESFPEVSRLVGFLVLAHESLDGKRSLLEGSCEGQRLWWQSAETTEPVSPYPDSRCVLR